MTVLHNNFDISVNNSIVEESPLSFKKKSFYPLAGRLVVVVGLLKLINF